LNIADELHQLMVGNEAFVAACPEGHNVRGIELRRVLFRHVVEVVPVIDSLLGAYSTVTGRTMH
jgi:hypothetical protein